MSTVGHPDWIAAPRGYTGALIYPVTNMTITAHTALQTTLLAAALYDVNVCNVLVPPDCRLDIWSASEIGANVVGPSCYNAGQSDQVAAIPVRSRGGNIIVRFVNCSAASRVGTLAVRGYNAVPAGELAMPPGLSTGRYVNIPAGAAVNVLEPVLPGLYDHCAWVVNMDRAFSVLRWEPVFPTDTSVTNLAEVIASSAAAGTLSGAFDIGTPGLVLQVRNDGAAGGNAYGTARLGRRDT